MKLIIASVVWWMVLSVCAQTVVDLPEQGFQTPEQRRAFALELLIFCERIDAALPMLTQTEKDFITGEEQKLADLAADREKWKAERRRLDSLKEQRLFLAREHLRVISQQLKRIANKSYVTSTDIFPKVALTMKYKEDENLELREWAQLARDCIDRDFTKLIRDMVLDRQISLENRTVQQLKLGIWSGADAKDIGRIVLQEVLIPHFNKGIRVRDVEFGPGR